MRKFLAILLAVLMVVPAFAFTTSAEEATPAQKLNIIPLITKWEMPDEDMDPDQVYDWRGPNGGQWICDLWVPSGSVDSDGNPVTGGRVVHYSAADKAVVRDWTGAGVKVAGWVKLGYQYFAPVDLSGIWDTGAICFDLYLSDPDALGADTVKYDFELRSPGCSDDNEWNASGKTPKEGEQAGYAGIGYQTLSQLYGGDLQAGWNHFEIPLSAFGLADTLVDTKGAEDTVTPDNTKINYFRMLNAVGDAIGTDGEDHKIMMKNIYFVDQCVYEPYTNPEAQIVDIWDGTTATTPAGYEVVGNVSNRKYPGGLVDVDGDGKKEFASIHAVQSETTLSAYGLITKGGGWQDAGNGLGSGWGIATTFTTKTGVFDASENAAGIRFEVFVSDTMIDPDGTYDTLNNADAYDTHLVDSSESWVFEITSARTSDYQEIRWIGTLKDIFGHQLVANTWVPVVLMFDKHDAATPGTAGNANTGDFRNDGANFIRLYNGDSEFFTFTGDLTIAMRNFQSIREVEEDTSERRTNVYGIEDDNGSCTNRKWFVPTAYADSMPSYADAGIARNQAIIAEHFKAGVQDKHTGGNWGTRTGELKGFTPIDTTGMDTICFDLFVNYYGTASLETMLANTWDAVKVDTGSTLATPFQMELTSGGASDVNEHTANTSLAKLTGIAKESITSLDDINGWHHVEIPLSEFALSTASQYKPGGSAYGNGEKYETNWAAINYFCLWLNGPYTAAEGVNLMLAVDNLYFKDSTYVAPEAPTPAIYVKTTPTLSNSFNLAYEISGNEYVISNPIVDVTFDGKTTTMGAAFSFEGILAHRLSDTIATTVTYLNADHQLMRGTLPYSIKQYAKSRLGKTGDETLDRLISDMLYYGAAAQSLIGYNTDNLASDVKGILPKTELDLDKLNSYKIENVIEDAATENGPAFKSAALVLDSELAIRVAFTGEAESLTIGGETYGSADFVAADGYYYVDFPVSANNFDEVYTAYFNGNADYALNYSVNHYLATKYKTTSPLADLYAAIYNYGVSADAYATVTGQND